MSATLPTQHRQSDTHHSSLLQSCGHDNDRALLLPHHPPEVGHSPVQRTLRRNVCLSIIVIALQGNRDRAINHTLTCLQLHYWLPTLM